MYKYVQHKERNNQPYKSLKKLSSKIAIYRFEIDEEKNNNLDLAELKAIVAELKALINEQRGKNNG